MVRLKDEKRLVCLALAMAFQFLMVRLKGSRKCPRHARSSISIPYGSIKSTVLTIYPRFRIGFQFLMVRLKVRLIPMLREEHANFNSLWFD